MPSTRRSHFLSSNELLSMNCEHGSTMAHPRANAQAVGRRFHWSAGSACSNAATIHDVSRKLGTSASTREIDTQMAWRGNAHTHVVAREKHGAAAAALRGSGQVCARSRRLTVINHELFDEVDVCEQHASTAVALEPQPLKCLHLRPLLTGRPVLDHFEEVAVHVPHGLQPPHARSVARRRG